MTRFFQPFCMCADKRKQRLCGCRTIITFDLYIWFDIDAIDKCMSYIYIYMNIYDILDHGLRWWDDHKEFKPCPGSHARDHRHGVSSSCDWTWCSDPTFQFHSVRRLRLGLLRHGLQLKKSVHKVEIGILSIFFESNVIVELFDRNLQAMVFVEMFFSMWRVFPDLKTS